MNPWNVDKLEKFLYFCCPECDLKDQSKVSFLQHALEKHPDAKECVLQFNEFIIKEEPCDVQEPSDKDYENFYAMDEDYGEMLECELKYEYNENSIKNENSTISSQFVDVHNISSQENKNKNLDNVNGNEDGTTKESYCYLCCKKFNSAYHLKRHKENVHEKIRYKCDLCEQSYTQKHFLKKHKKEAHDIFEFNKDSIKNESSTIDSEFPIQQDLNPIEICNINSQENKETTLNIANVNEEGKEKEPYCYTCCKKFNTTWHLKRHNENVHEGIRYKCELCEQSYTQKFFLKKHKKEAHDILDTPPPPIVDPNTSKKIYEDGKKDKHCSLCDKSFVTTQTLRNHMETIHEGLKHKCPHCDKEFGFQWFELSL